ncbi:MAG: type IV pilus twitching motility protein PilT [Nitrospirota bacterium]|nr:type IV pilus twitching motility protein PilT [Nitrospirota bacterium]
MAVSINDLLKTTVENKASDLHLKVGIPPVMRLDGGLAPMMDQPKLSREDVVALASSIMNNSQKEKFKTKCEVDLAYGVPGLGRFRVNAFQQRGTISMVFRHIPIRIPTIDELKLPKVLEKLALERRGLILVTGTTGSGKSTSLAAMIDHINTTYTDHIITIEDPVEFLHLDKKSIINQREVGIDTDSFSSALRAALRQDPDVILVGEMRDLDTIETALTAAETGHLVMSTLHTTDATETINRIITVFPPHQHQQIRIQLAAVLKGIVSMRLIPKSDGKGRVPAVEVLVATLTVKESIIDSTKTKLIHDIIAAGRSQYGMQTFDQSLLDLYKQGLITYEEALKNASNVDDFVLKVKGIMSTSDLADEDEKGQSKSFQKPGAGGGEIKLSRLGED